MKTKILFIGVLLSLQVQIIYSKSVNVELSVTWEKGYDIFKKDSIVCIPYLNIVYRNDSDIPLYFLKLSDSKAGLPMLPIGSLLQYPIEEFLNPDYRKRAEFHGDYTNQDYSVIIGGPPLYNKGWLVEKDTITEIEGVETEGEINMINSDLFNIYRYLHHSKAYDVPEKGGIFFSESDIVPDSILYKLTDRFIFLQPGESYVDTYNLTGFKLIKGNFTFCIKQKYFMNYVDLEPVWDEDQSRYISRTGELPTKAGEYILYSGEFNSNEVTIDF